MVARKFLLSILLYQSKLKSISPLLYYCGENLSKVSYRIPRKEKNDYLAGLRIMKRLVFDVFSKQANCILFPSNTHIAVYDGDDRSASLREAYIQHFANEKPKLHISRNNLLYNSPFLFRLKSLLLIALLFVPITVFSLFNSNRSGPAFLLREYLESCRLLNILQIHGITKLHHFCIFERDANISAHILMQSGIVVNKIPSEVPLHFFNKTIVASSLSFCFAYQQEEFLAYHQSMFVKTTQHWAPELILKAPQRFLMKRKGELLKNQTNLGFYSSGNWLREKLGDVDLGHNDKENEELLLKMLIQLAESKKLSLTIFLHPIEKRLANKALTDAYYVPLVKSSGIQIGPLNQASIESFDTVNLAVSLYSTLMFERIYLGFKTILAPWGYPEFPMANSPFKNICVMEPNALAEKIQYNLELSPLDFFNKNQISHYTHYLNS